MKVTPKAGNNFIQCDHMISLLMYMYLLNIPKANTIYNIYINV